MATPVARKKRKAPPGDQSKDWQEYLFLDNFRGFSQTLIPLAQVNFLVGENSTGKSSFLMAAHLLHNPRFRMEGWFDAPDGDGSLSFNDIVSVGALDRSYFSLGQLQVRRTPSGSPSSRFFALRFRAHDGMAEVSDCVVFSGDAFVRLTVQDSKSLYQAWNKRLAAPPDASQISKYLAESDEAPEYRQLPGPAGLPPAYHLAMISEELSFQNVSPHTPTVWLAPIRAKARRHYEPIGGRFTPEGHHAPYTLQRVLRSGTEADEFSKLLRMFGAASGLFEDVRVHEFGGKSAPFEVQIKLRRRDLNLMNVGYGVSQVLPLTVEVLARRGPVRFCLQQPEVHLHPRAQAAFGQLVHWLAARDSHSYLIETHSDYLIDRFRLMLKESNGSSPPPPSAQVLFFDSTPTGNHVEVLKIDERGRYPQDPPAAFREFFINEELRLLEI
jgi:predicted ATPase